MQLDRSGFFRLANSVAATLATTFAVCSFGCITPPDESPHFDAYLIPKASPETIYRDLLSMLQSGQFLDRPDYAASRVIVSGHTFGYSEADQLQMLKYVDEALRRDYDPTDPDQTRFRQALINRLNIVAPISNSAAVRDHFATLDQSAWRVRNEP